MEVWRGEVAAAGDGDNVFLSVITSKSLTAFLRPESYWLKGGGQSKDGILLSAQNSLGVFYFHKCCLFSNSSSIFR